MGRLNKQRRADKRRHRVKSRPAGSHRRVHSAAPPSIDELISVAATALSRGSSADHRAALGMLGDIDRTPGGRVSVDGALTGTLERTVALLWDNGWQPADLVHVVRRKLGAVGAALVGAVIVGQSRAYLGDAALVEPVWRAQLDELGVRRPASGARYLADAGAVAGLAWLPTVERCIELYALLDGLPALARLGPGPREWGRRPRVAAAASTGIDERMLGRVRALLAKAESTEFPEEAEALTAKAQELMARHAIDHALLDGDARGAEPIGRRLAIDDPYASEKSYLVAVIAGANRCEAVWFESLALSTVIGFPAALDAVELLYTSLLVQASTALRVIGAHAPPGARQRGTAFRRSFYVGFAGRIKERLTMATSRAVDDALRDHGDRLLPVLASRQLEVTDAMHRMFPGLSHHRVGASDRAGLTAGRIAADAAQLSCADELEASA